MGEQLLRVRTVALAAGAALLVVACGGNKPADTPVAETTTEEMPTETPMDMAPVDSAIADPAVPADTMAAPVDPMAPPAEVPTEAPAQ